LTRNTGKEPVNIIEKLRSDTAHYWDKPFLKAAMAACALTTLADDEVTKSEREAFDQICVALNVSPDEIWQKMSESG
jgi:tellurite resistance protein